MFYKSVYRDWTALKQGMKMQTVILNYCRGLAAGIREQEGLAPPCVAEAPPPPPSRSVSRGAGIASVNVGKRGEDTSGSGECLLEHTGLEIMSQRQTSALPPERMRHRADKGREQTLLYLLSLVQQPTLLHDLTALMKVTEDTSNINIQKQLLLYVCVVVFGLVCLCMKRTSEKLLLTSHYC